MPPRKGLLASESDEVGQLSTALKVINLICLKWTA
ncbi:MAG: hypothetical protein CM15mP86_19640 [Gammaproteobacteria bacterium]|nr:MAG: hypothetical protein CM15mP86_19640 [Gammaproteobacteria bacterium]